MKSLGLAIDDGIAAKIFRFVDGSVPGQPDKHIIKCLLRRRDTSRNVAEL